MKYPTGKPKMDGIRPIGAGKTEMTRDEASRLPEAATEALVETKRRTKDELKRAKLNVAASDAPQREFDIIKDTRRIP